MISKHKKIVFLCFISAFSFSFSSAQNSLKIYSNFLYLNSIQEPGHFDYEKSAFTYNHLSFAYRYQNSKGRVQEWELRGLIKSEAGDNHRVDQLDVHLRYENGKYLRKELFNKIRIQLGYAAKLFYLHEDINSLDYNVFPVKRDWGGLNLAFFTHLEYDLTDRIYLDLNTSVAGVSFGLDYMKIEDPVLNEDQQKQGGAEFNFFGERILRFGIGFRLGYMGNEEEEDELQKEWEEKQKKKGKRNKKKRKKKKRN